MKSILAKLKPLLQGIFNIKNILAFMQGFCAAYAIFLLSDLRLMPREKDRLMVLVFILFAIFAAVLYNQIKLLELEKKLDIFGATALALIKDNIKAMDGTVIIADELISIIEIVKANSINYKEKLQ